MVDNVSDGKNWMADLGPKSLIKNEATTDSPQFICSPLKADNLLSEFPPEKYHVYHLFRPGFRWNICTLFIVMWTYMYAVANYLIRVRVSVGYEA